MFIAALHFIATDRELYWTLRWFDAPMHFLGGGVMALLAGWVGMRVIGVPFLLAGKTRHFFLIIAATLVAGVMWEFFELFIGIGQEPGYALDTLHDLLFDLAGGLLGYLLIRFFLLKMNTGTV